MGTREEAIIEFLDMVTEDELEELREIFTYWLSTVQKMNVQVRFRQFLILFFVSWPHYLLKIIGWIRRVVSPEKGILYYLETKAIPIS